TLPTSRPKQSDREPATSTPSHNDAALLVARSRVASVDLPPARTSDLRESYETAPLASTPTTLPILTLAAREPCSNDSRPQAVDVSAIPMLARLIIRAALLVSKGPAMTYPLVALIHRAQGEVTVHGLIGPDGSISGDPAIEKSTAGILLNKAAVDNVRK